MNPLKTRQDAPQRIRPRPTWLRPAAAALRAVCNGLQWLLNGRETLILANHGQRAGVCVPMVNDFEVIQDNWVQLAPLGDYPNQGPVDRNGRAQFPQGVIQRVDRAAVTEMVNEFTAEKKERGTGFGLPWYIGHPDQDRQRYPDDGSYGWIIELKDGGDKGLLGCVKWTEEGEKIKTSGKYKYFSPCWYPDKTPVGIENGKPVMKPILLASVGFTNNPQIPVMALSNAAEPVTAALTNEVVAANTLIDLAVQRGALLENEQAEWLKHFEEDFEGAALVLVNAGTSEGAKKGWETRRGNMAAKKAKAPKAAAKVAARAKKAGPGSKAAWKAKDKADAAAGEKSVAAIQASRASAGAPEKPTGEKIKLPETTPPPLPQRAASTAASSVKARGFLGLGRLAGESPIEHLARLTGFGKP